MTYPAPPYLYDDPRFTYDDTIFWDGDIVIPDPVVVVVFRGGGSSGAAARHVEVPVQNRKKIIPPEHRVNFELEIYADLRKINNKKANLPEIIKKYHLNYKEIDVLMQKFIHKENFLTVSGYQSESINKTNNIPSVIITDKIKVSPLKTIVSGALETRIKESTTVIKSDSIIILKVKKE